MLLNEEKKVHLKTGVFDAGKNLDSKSLHTPSARGRLPRALCALGAESAGVHVRRRTNLT